ncbi:SRPBCC family protein [Streptomyces thermoviolaceus]|uniref:SRPBCC family protein n=1 Tax=Streptomyces thermoviolaceus TaxID=1952 RepID=UPI0020408470|nr:SRPBCC family protein [Streptomyces thermoviolaceus]MCM3265121.1 SRPBCC family protein [Streptomyces thermoviolaceus]
MTETFKSAASAAGRTAGSATDAAKDNPLTALAHSEATDRLKTEAQDYLAAQAERLLAGFGRKLGTATGKLTDIAEGNSPGFGKLALDAGRKLAEGKSPVRSVLELGASRAKDSVMGAFKNIGGGKGGGKSKGAAGSKPVVIIESIDVGVPVRTAYDQWTRFQDFSTFAHGVKSASRADDTHSDWQAKIFLSSRSWKATTTEQIPDYRIQWTSEGAKGTTKGVVSFHSLEKNLTRVLLVMEYYPSGFFEKTGNIWRAQGRRVRLDLKHFARFITLKGEVEDGWRGEIRDSEVVRSHEDAVAEEERAEQSEEEGEDEAAHDEDEQEPAGEDEEEQQAADEEEPEGEEESYEDDEEEPEGEEEPYEDDGEEPYEDEDEEEPYEDDEDDYDEEQGEEDAGGEPRVRRGESFEEYPEDEGDEDGDQDAEDYEQTRGGGRR